MSSYTQPRRGSMAFYPRKRALKQTPSMRAYGNDAKALNFLCYKVGMVQVMGKNIHHGSPTFGQEVVIPATIIVCPPMKVFGVRAYTKAEIGVEVLGDVLAENTDKILLRKILNFKKPKKKEGKEAAEKGGKEKEGKESKEKEKKKGKEAPCTISDFEKELNDVEYFTLLAHTAPDRVEIKKTPDICEISIGGKKEGQLVYAREKLGKEINIEEIAKGNDFLDVKAVTTGKGFQGVVKRFHVRMQRPKAKTRRVVGSIGPWHPHTVMFTVARAGQMGYQSRTEYNKRVLKISDKPEEINSKSGFINYGNIIGKYAIIQGTLPGPTKRCIAIRKSTRPERKKGIKLETVSKVIVN